ncbi:MAG: hypothetical protein R3F56_07325 [Planctomycetota bacterium]
MAARPPRAGGDIVIELAQPARAWWLLAGVLLFLLAVPPRPGRELLTAHLPQWFAALRRCRRVPLRFPWLRTVLLLLAFTGAVLAWCRPRRPAKPGPTRLTVVVDASASLAARTAGGLRAHDELLASLRAGLQRLPPHVRAQTRFVRCAREVSFFDDSGRIGEPAPCALGVHLAPVAAQAGDADTAVWTLTDGRDGLPDVGALTVVGAPLDNVALCALRVDDRWPLPDIEVEVEVANFSQAARSVTLHIGGTPDALAEIPTLAPLELAPGAREVVRFAGRRRGGGSLQIACTVSDALALDDRVECTLPPPPVPRIAVLSDSDAPILRKAAEALAAETMGDVIDARGAGARAGFVLVEGGTQRAEDWRDLRGLLFGTTLAGEEPPEPDTTRTDGAVEWRRDDPLTAGLDFSELRLQRAPSPIGGETLVSMGGRPLISVRAGRRVVQCAFRLTDANLWLLPAFPQLLRRAYAAAHAEVAAVRSHPDNLLAPAESDLRNWTGAGQDRPLPAFGAPAHDLTGWFALVALVCLLGRAWLTRAA